MTQKPIPGTANVYALFPDQAADDADFDRLRRAARSIVAAVEEQKAAIADFRATLNELRQSTDKLQRTTVHNLGSVGRVADTLSSKNQG